MHFNDICTVFVHISVILGGFFEGAKTLLFSYCDTHTHTHTDTETKYSRQIYDKFSFIF
jgi:hypothetical protein